MMRYLQTLALTIVAWLGWILIGLAVLALIGEFPRLMHGGH